jgi:hypothetical protein
MVTAAVVIGLVALVVLVTFDRDQRECPFCGSRRNEWRSRFPVCQSCGRDRT